MQGWLASQLRCDRCETLRAINHEPFIDLSLPLPTNNNNNTVGTTSKRLGGKNVPGFPAAYAFNQQQQQQSDTNISQLLSSFTAKESIDNVDCTHCSASLTISSIQEELSQSTSTINSAATSMHSDCDTPSEASYEQQPEMEDLVKSLHRIQMDEEAIHDPTLPIAAHHKKRVRSKTTKVTTLSRLPPVLCIHVCRRVISPVTGVMTKVGQHVKFSTTLDVSNILEQGGDVRMTQSQLLRKLQAKPTNKRRTNHSISSQDGSYSLQAVIVHHGTADSGHYTTYRLANRRWHHISDEKVRDATEDEVLTSQAYMLFYVNNSEAC